MRNACALGFLLAMGPGIAAAALSDEIQVYTDDINAPGERGLELHVNATPKGRSLPDYPGEVVPNHGLRVTPEFSYGLTTTWEAGLYLPANFDSRGRGELAGAKLRLKWLPVKGGDEGGWFFGANTELSRLQEKFSASRDGLELRIMAGHRSAEWLLAVNPVFGWDLSSGFRKGTPDLSLGIKATRSLSEYVAIGAEYYSDLGTASRILPAREQANTLYAVIDVDLKGWGFNFGVGRALTDAADRYTVKAILEIPFQ